MQRSARLTARVAASATRDGDVQEQMGARLVRLAAEVHDELRPMVSANANAADSMVGEVKRLSAAHATLVEDLSQ